MNLTVQAVYEDGVLKPEKPLPLQDRERVQVTIHRPGSPLLGAYGVMGFQGSAAEADYFALDAELEYPPPPEEP